MPKPINIIVACAENRVIGTAGKLPWSLPEDFAYFLGKIAGGVVVEGRKAFEEFGKPLEGAAATVVLTRNPDWAAAGVVTAPDLRSGLDRAEELPGDTIWICGGTRVYEEALPLAGRLVLTLVHAEFEGDATFPDWREHFPIELSRRDSRDEPSGIAYTFYELGRDAAT